MKDPLKIKAIIKILKLKILNLIPLKLKYKQGDRKNILLYATRRGGSTIVMQLLSVDEDTRDISEPFELFHTNNLKGKIKLKSLPSKYFSQYITLNKSEEKQVLNYLSSLLSGKYQEFQVYYKANRTVVKIVNALPLIDFFSEKLDVYTLYFVRHPIPQALSIVKNKWGITAKAYLADKLFCDNYLTQTQIEFCKKILNECTYLEQAALSWCLENLFPLKFSKTEKMILTYEELVLNTDKVINYLFDNLHISNKKAMFDILRKPSRSSHLSLSSTKEAIFNQDKTKIVGRWESEISQTDKAKVQIILDKFDIFEYKADSILPSKSLLLFKNATL